MILWVDKLSGNGQRRYRIRLWLSSFLSHILHFLRIRGDCALQIGACQGANRRVKWARVSASPPQFPTIDFNERPFILFWEVTRACALACRHCRAIAQPRPHPEELNHEEALHLVDTIAELHPPMLVLTGGDPMMRRDIFELIERATERGLRVALSPAATPRLLHTDFNRLRAAGVVSLSLSLDGASRETHDAFRGVPHTFERTLEAARAAMAAGIQLQVNTTLTRSTLSEMDGFISLMKELRPDVWSVFVLVPTGRASCDELPGADEVEQVWQRLVSLRKELPFAIKTTEGHHYRRVLLQAARQAAPHAGASATARHIIPTRDGKGVAFISHTGDIQPSGFLPLTAGNVRTDDLATIYRTHPIFTSLRDDNALGGKCGQCEYRHLCGGSRSRAYGTTGDMFAAEPLCNYIPAALRNAASPLTYD